MTSLVWKLNRLKLMGGPEIAWRVRQLLQKKASQIGIGLCGQPPAPSDVTGPRFLHRDQLQEQAAIQAAADDILAGSWNVFSMRGLKLGFPPVWNRDPKTGIDAPMKLGKSIDYRSEKIVGDIKYLWEPSRHLELTTLALAWEATGDRRYLLAVRTLLQSWFEQCPYPMGVHWTSSLELAVRLLNWAYVWELCGAENSPLFEGEAGAQFRRSWMDTIYQHCHFISGYFSRHSSANNHLLGEYMGLFVASTIWPCWPASAGWRVLSRRGFEREALRQNFADGVNKEQAVYYQHEVMDMMLHCQLIAQAAGDSFSPVYLARLEQLANFLASVMDVGGHVPMIGDADDAQMARLNYGGDTCVYRSLLASCAVLFGRADLKARAGAYDDKNRLLFGSAGQAIWDELSCNAQQQPTLAFPDGGYFILGKCFGQADEVRLVADAGPLGYLSIAAHGHADALAFTLSVGGAELLIDPGTYAYHTHVLWRNYFRSTAAHNTVCIDDLDQSEIAGNFMWMHKANARLLAHRTDDRMQVFEAEHDGYMRLPDPVLHRRRIEFNAEENSITVTDRLQCQTNHTVQISWNFSEHCIVEFNGESLRVQNGKAGLTMSCALGGGAPVLLRGSEAPIAGWISRQFDMKIPTTTAAWRGEICEDTEIVTVITLH